MKTLLGALLDGLNRHAWGRWLLYRWWRLVLSVCFPLVRGEAALLRFYRAHLRMLAPFFAGALAAEGVVGRLAQGCDEAWIEAVHRLLERTQDDRQAQTLNKALIAFEHQRRLERLASYPKRIYLEMTDACNLQCPMCAQTVFTAPGDELALDTVARVQHVLRYAELISFVGCGETLMHPQFMAIVSAAAQPQAETRIITNGILLKEEVSRQLIEQGLDQLWFSLDASTEDTYELIRGKRRLELILKNIRRLHELKKEAGSECPHTALTFVARRDNLEELGDYVRLAADLGVEGVHVGYLIVYRKELAQQSLYYHQELSDRLLLEAKAEAERLGLDFFGPQLFAEERPGPPPMGSKCIDPYDFVYVRAEGTLSPCCVNDRRMGGLLAEHSFEELWNGPEYRRFRRVVSTPEQDLHCKHCVLPGYQDVREIEHHIKLIDEDVRVIEDD
jgi:MoaA/NifB/PqqE/SkfB family radical SAM enzyme